MKIQVLSGAAGLDPEEAEARINTEGSSDLPEKLGFSADLSPFGCQLS